MGKHEQYIINEDEMALLERIEGITGGRKTPEHYIECSKEGLAIICSLKDKSIDLFTRRYKAAREVIDIIAKSVGINPDDCGFWLYAADTDGTTQISKKIESWFSRSGEKAQLKRRVQELEQENAILRSVLQK